MSNECRYRYKNWLNFTYLETYSKLQIPYGFCIYNYSVIEVNVNLIIKKIYLDLFSIRFEHSTKSFKFEILNTINDKKFLKEFF